MGFRGLGKEIGRRGSSPRGVWHAHETCARHLEAGGLDAPRETNMFERAKEPEPRISLSLLDPEFRRMRESVVVAMPILAKGDPAETA
jgi:hypothetical protein